MRARASEVTFSDTKVTAGVATVIAVISNSVLSVFGKPVAASVIKTLPFKIPDTKVSPKKLNLAMYTSVLVDVPASVEATS